MPLTPTTSTATTIWSILRTNPLTSPTVALAAIRIVALLSAFHLQGWSYCIPCIAFLGGKIARVRWQKLFDHAYQLVVLGRLSLTRTKPGSQAGSTL